MTGKKLGKRIVELSSSSEENEMSSSPFLGAKPDWDELSSHEQDAELDENSFIVADDNEVPDLPAEFRSAEDITHHHKIICQLFVHVAVQEPQDRHPYMEDAIRRESAQNNYSV